MINFTIIKNFGRFALLILSLVGMCETLKAQVLLDYKGNYDAIVGVYDGNHFMVEDGSRQFKYTTDGGSTFQNINLNLGVADRIRQVHYLSTSEIFIGVYLGSGDVDIYKSTDGGATFNKQGNVVWSGYLTISIESFIFYDSNEGIIECRGSYNGDIINTLHKTTDGGASWTLIGDTTEFEDVRDIALYPSGDIVLMKETPGVMEVSKDRGATFTPLASNPPNNSGLELGYNGVQNYYVVGVPGSQNYCCYISADGGASFNQWNAADDADDIVVNTDGDILVFGTSDTLSLSTDDGATFEPVIFGPNKPVGSLMVIRVASDGKMFYVFDGSARLWTLGSGSTIGLNETDANRFSVYPNPTRDVINVEGINAEVKIYSLSGMLMMDSKSKKNINVSELPTGMYLLKAGDRFAKFNKL